MRRLRPGVWAERAEAVSGAFPGESRVGCCDAASVLLAGEAPSGREKARKSLWTAPVSACLRASSLFPAATLFPIVC